jgi:hypothetical protein
MEDLLVELNPMNSDDENLVKKVETAYLGRTFDELVQEALNPSPNELNPDGYTPAEIEVCNALSNLYNKRTENPNAVHLYAIPNTSGSAIRVKFDDSVNQYKDQILREEFEVIDGKEYQFHRITLVMNRPKGGGNQ